MNRFLCLLLLIPVIAHAANDSETLAESTRQPRAFFLDTVIWKDPNYNIQVCWVDLSDSSESNRILVQDAVYKSWQAHSKVNFTGWRNQCPNNFFDGIRINVRHGSINRFLDIDPNSRAPLGTKGQNDDRKVQLNFDANSDVNQQCFDRANYPISLEQCNRATAIHEFGHILGMAHEQNRPEDTINSGCHTKNDNPDESEGLTFITYGNTYFTGYDADSIMNYCRQDYGLNSELSRTDKLAVKVYYGRVPTYTDETRILEVPVFRFGGNNYKATLEYQSSSNTFLLKSFSPTAKTSSVTSTLINSIVDLPFIRYIKGEHVTDVVQIKLKSIGNNQFSLTFFDQHPDAIK